MNLEVQRFSSDSDSTLGLLFQVVLVGRRVLRRFLCFTLEDEHRTVKVSGETRIPAGNYRLTLRKEGGHHQRYGKRYGSWHKGMLWVREVPGFEWILIHVGNDDDDTAGCLLVGDSARQNISQSGQIQQSRKAYERIYPEIAASIERGDDVWITYIDHDTAKEQ